jgi:7-keto-8-aminopelargonate synthetase-like enzyme
MLNHISIFLGCKLSKSPRKTYLHKDMNHLERILKKNKNRRKLIITDGVFGMDGDLAPLPEIVELARMYEAMVMIDDAHATGVIGENGRGTPEHFGLEGKIDIVMGTLSKAVGALGGYVTASPEVIKLLRVTAPSYVYSSSLPPEQAFGIIAALKIIQERPELRHALWRNVDQVRTGIQAIGFDTLQSETQIIPVLIGEEGKCIKAARLLFEKGILASPFISPVVPKGKARIRICVTAVHTEAQIRRLLEALRDMGKKLEIV